MRLQRASARGIIIRRAAMIGSGTAPVAPALGGRRSEGMVREVWTVEKTSTEVAREKRPMGKKTHRKEK